MLEGFNSFLGLIMSALLLHDVSGQDWQNPVIKLWPERTLPFSTLKLLSFELHFSPVFLLRRDRIVPYSH